MKSAFGIRAASRHLAGGLLFSLLSIGSPAQGAPVTLDFEGLTAGYHGGVSDYADGALQSNGFVLDPGAADWSPDAQNWIGHYGIASDWGADNGTNYFVFDYFLDGSRLNIYGEDGGVFGVQSLDLAESSGTACSFNQPPSMHEASCSVTFTGYLGDQAIVSQTITLDGIHDGSGGLTDFQTFNFNGSWNQLTRFTIEGGHEYLNPALDNLVLSVVSPVPEPEALAMMVFGFAVVVATTRRGKGA